MNDLTPAPHRNVLITGASSGIGAALATSCAAAGVTLFLSGRDSQRLGGVADACRAKGAVVYDRVLDVCDAPAMQAWIENAGRLDLVVANAGVGGGSDDGRPESTAQVRALFATNLDGALNTALPALEAMLRQEPDATGVRGRIAIVASVAAFVPGPGAASYCAAKAAIDRWTVATAHTAGKHGVVMTSICPGYVRTAMTEDNKFPMPGLMTAERAAEIILSGIAQGRRRVVFPWWVGLAAKLVGALPPSWSTALLAKPPGKAPMTKQA